MLSQVLFRDSPRRGWDRVGHAIGEGWGEVGVEVALPLDAHIAVIANQQVRAIQNRRVPKSLVWETDFYTPPVLGGAALFDNSAPAVYKTQGP